MFLAPASLHSYISNPHRFSQTLWANLKAELQHQKLRATSTTSALSKRHKSSAIISRRSKSFKTSAPEMKKCKQRLKNAALCHSSTFFSWFVVRCRWSTSYCIALFRFFDRNALINKDKQNLPPVRCCVQIKKYKDPKHGRRRLGLVAYQHTC